MQFRCCFSSTNRPLVYPTTSLKLVFLQLCEESMTHSALNKALAEDVNRETGLEKVIDTVATFKKPASNSR